MPYVCKSNSAVVTLSITHHGIQVEVENKTVIVIHRNSKNSGIDSLDHLAGLVSDKTRRQEDGHLFCSTTLLMLVAQ